MGPRIYIRNTDKMAFLYHEGEMMQGCAGESENICLNYGFSGPWIWQSHQAFLTVTSAHSKVKLYKTIYYDRVWMGPK